MHLLTPSWLFAQPVMLLRTFPKLHILKHVFRNSAAKKTTFVGIDLGTTNSCVAYLEVGKPQVIPNGDGSRITPSVVAFTNENDSIALVGTPAKRQAVANAKNTVFAIKRLIGRRFNDADIQSVINRLPFDILETPDGGIELIIGKKRYVPSELSACILREMKSIAEKHLCCEVKDAVITVPAYFNDSQRQATKNAGEQAGLTIHRIINEPTAAALAYGIDRSENKVIAVYDLGGGTFDISLLELSKGVFEVRSTNGDTLLGGEDFDNLLVAYIVQKINVPFDHIDPSALQRIKEAAEEAKIVLSTDTQTTVNLPFISTSETGSPIHIEIKLSRKQYESMVRDLVQRTIRPCVQALNDAEVSKAEVDEVILVGGMTRMPIVKSTVRRIFNKEPCEGVNPDEAVAIGAAIQAGVLCGEIEDVLLLDVTPLSLGIETLGGGMVPLLSRNTSVPARVTQVFSTAMDGQTQVEINIYQGERELAQENKLLGNFVLVDIPPQKRGVPRIEVTFDIDVNGILNVSACEQSTGKGQRLIINPTTKLSPREVREALTTAGNHTEADCRHLGAIEAATSLSILAEDVVAKVIEFGDRLPTAEAEAVIKFCRGDVLAHVEELRSAKDLEELRRLNEDLQKRALELFQKSTYKRPD